MFVSDGTFWLTIADNPDVGSGPSILFREQKNEDAIRVLLARRGDGEDWTIVRDPHDIIGFVTREGGGPWQIKVTTITREEYNNLP